MSLADSNIPPFISQVLFGDTFLTSMLDVMSGYPLIEVAVPLLLAGLTRASNSADELTVLIAAMSSVDSDQCAGFRV